MEEVVGSHVIQVNMMANGSMVAEKDTERTNGQTTVYMCGTIQRISDIVDIVIQGLL